MSSPMDVFIASNTSLEDIVKELEMLLHASTQRYADSYETWYVIQDEHILYSVGDHEYVNDRDVNFEDYQYDIEIQVINVKDADEKIKLQVDATHRIFNLLKQTKKYPLMLVDNLQNKLEEFHP